jgi:hypothetical protein
MLAVRTLDAFACTVSLTVPVPMPPAGVAVIQEGRPATAHVQPAAVATATSTEPPLEVALKLDGFRLNEHCSCGPFNWFTVTT